MDPLKFDITDALRNLGEQTPDLNAPIEGLTTVALRLPATKYTGAPIDTSWMDAIDMTQVAGWQPQAKSTSTAAHRVLSDARPKGEISSEVKELTLGAMGQPKEKEALRATVETVFDKVARRDSRKSIGQIEAYSEEGDEDSDLENLAKKTRFSKAAASTSKPVPARDNVSSDNQVVDSGMLAGGIGKHRGRLILGTLLAGFQHFYALLKSGKENVTAMLGKIGRVKADVASASCSDVMRGESIPQPIDTRPEMSSNQQKILEILNKPNESKLQGVEKFKALLTSNLVLPFTELCLNATHRDILDFAKDYFGSNINEGTFKEKVEELCKKHEASMKLSMPVLFDNIKRAEKREDVEALLQPYLNITLNDACDLLRKGVAKPPVNFPEEKLKIVKGVFDDVQKIVVTVKNINCVRFSYIYLKWKENQEFREAFNELLQMPELAQQAKFVKFYISSLEGDPNAKAKLKGHPIISEMSQLADNHLDEFNEKYLAPIFDKIQRLVGSEVSVF